MRRLGFGSLRVGGQPRGLIRHTPQATTSGTAFNYTALRPGLDIITILLDGVSVTGTNDFLIQIGDSGGLETTGYAASSHTGGSGVASTSGFPIRVAAAASIVSGRMELVRLDGNIWINAHSVTLGVGSGMATGGGSKTLTAELDRVTLTRTGADTFDLGQVNILTFVG